MRIGSEPVVVADSVSTTCSGEESCIILREGGVRTEAFAVLSSTGSTPILAPDEPQAVSAVLVAPQVPRLLFLSVLDEFFGDGRFHHAVLRMFLPS